MHYPPRIEVADARALPLEAETVDMIITSPPYALGIEYPTGDVDPDDWPGFMRAWLSEAYRVARPGCRLALNVPADVTKGGYRPTWPIACAEALAAGWQYRSHVRWMENHISRSVARGSKDSPSAPHIITPGEVVGIFFKGDWRRPAPAGVVSDLEHSEWLAWTLGEWRIKGELQPWGGHPAPFPLELPRRLIKLLSYPGDVVLDPFIGSGTTAAAAYQLGRRAVGFDVAAEYVDLARRRVAACTLPLFPPGRLAVA